MSAESTRVSERHFAYIAERTPREDAFLRDLKRAALAEGIPAIWIAPEQASFMQILLRLCGAKRVVEVGTLAGSAAIAMARALPPDGQVVTIELSDKHADFAERWIGRSDVAGKVVVRRGAGMDVLPTLPAGQTDAVFLDADKTSYGLYLREALRLLRPNGLVMVDNAFAFGQLFEAQPTDREVPAVRAFNEVMAREPALHSVIVPLGDGLWVGVKR